MEHFDSAASYTSPVGTAIGRTRNRLLLAAPGDRMAGQARFNATNELLLSGVIQAAVNLAAEE